MPVKPRSEKRGERAGGLMMVMVLVTVMVLMLVMVLVLVMSLMMIFFLIIKNVDDEDYNDHEDAPVGENGYNNKDDVVGENGVEFNNDD